MHLRSSLRSALGSAALALLAGCASTQQPPPPDGTTAPDTTAPDTTAPGTTAPPPRSDTVTASPQQPPAPSDSPWQRARVGDRVVYTFYANRSARPGAREGRIAGRLALEAVAVQAPWVWLRLSFTDEKGRPMTNPMLSKELVFPMNMEASRPLDVPREGTQSNEQLTAAGRTWEARRYIRDNRPADGPLENRLYAESPGPLYLMNGLLAASDTLSGFGASGGSQLTLVEARRGSEGNPAAPLPALEHPFGPGTWSDASTNMGKGDELHRSCSSAERGYVLNVSMPAPAAGGAPCPSFADAEVVPLEESLLSLIGQSTTMTGWPPPAVAPTSRGTFSAQGRGIPALTFETQETEGTTRQIRYEIYAADPWSPALAGLGLMARFNPLAEGVDRLQAPGQRQPTFTKQLIGWGTWTGGAK